ncbi:MAG: fumarylacetoacetate hydrolase family protein [Sneathiellaceae bacterium]
MSVEQVAAALAEARKKATPLTAFPGTAPTDLATAYAIQDRAVALGGRKVAGWKVAMVPPPLREGLGVDRIAGPIFADSLQTAGAGGSLQAPVHPGFAALESEFAVRLSRDLDPAAAPFTPEGLAGAVASLHAAVEIATSIVAGNGDAGPCPTVADHGNNGGAILGPAIPGWQDKAPDDLATRMSLDGTVVGEGGVAAVPGGPLAALAFLANLLAGRGIGLKAGDIVLTGQTNGVHRVAAGQTARAECPGVMALDLTVTAARPL